MSMATPAQQMSKIPQVMEDNTELEVREPLFGSGAQALDVISRGEIDTQIATAHRFPRSVTRSLEEALTLATMDEETAESCFYVLPPRSGSSDTIEGPSVRLAEIFASCWGNIRVASRVVAEEERFIVAMGACLDLQKNSFSSFEVKRRITTKHGKRYSDDMIQQTGNAAQSIARRNAIFQVIPRSYVNKVWMRAKEVAAGNLESLAKKREKWLAWFKTHNITLDRVLARLGKAGLDDIGLSEMAILIGIATAIKDKQISADEAFPPIATADKPGDAPPALQTKATVAADHVAKVAAEAKKTSSKKSEPSGGPSAEELEDARKREADEAAQPK